MKIPQSILITVMGLVIAGVATVLLGMAFSTTANVTPGQIVPCSDYHKIVDIYKTPSHEVLETDDGMLYQKADDFATSIGSLWFQGNPSKGQYISKKSVIYRAINLTELTEEESGMRDACRVEP